MLFDSTTVLLRSIVTSLENDGGTLWDNHLGYGNQCLYELHQMSRSAVRPAKAESSKFHAGTPPFARAVRAIPHLKSMMRSLRLQDRAAAIESGRAALAEMDGTRTTAPAPPS